MRTYLAPLIIGLCIILGIVIAATAYRYRFTSSETILVTGSAETDFVSDQIVWRGTFSRSGADLRSVYASLKADEAEIRRYLNANNIADTNIVFSSIDIQRNYESQFDEHGRVVGNRFSGYNLVGTVTVDSRNIAVVEKLSREITALLEKGIELNSTPPSYYYSRLNALKIDLLAKAAADAKRRAETIATHSEASLGDIRKATMGVFQIIGKNTNEDFSYGGAFNTTSKEKTATITLRVEYQVR